MTPEMVLTVARESLTVTILVAAPLLLAALVTGVLAAPLIMPVVEYIGERALGRWPGRLRRRDGDAPPRAA